MYSATLFVGVPHGRKGGSTIKQTTLSLVGTLLLLSLGVLCAIYAPVTALNLVVEETLPVLCLCGVLAAGVCATLWGARGLIPVTLAALLALLFVYPSVLLGAQAALSEFTNELGSFFNVPHLFAGVEATARDMTLFFGAAGIGLSIVLACSMQMRHGTLLGVLATLPLVCPAFAFVPLPPAVWCAVGLLGFYLALMFRGGFALGSDSPKKRRRAVHALPALALAGLLLGTGILIAPPRQYTQEDWTTPLLMAVKAAIPALRPILEQIDGTAIGMPSIGVWFFNTGRVPIADAGPRTDYNQQILRVTADRAGTYYLRGSSMESFDGRTWTSNQTASYGLSAFADQSARRIPTRLAQVRSTRADNELPLLQMTIVNTADLSGILYLPYYTDFTRIYADDRSYSPYWLTDSFLSSQAWEHEVAFYHPAGSVLSLIDLPDRQGDAMYLYYYNASDLYDRHVNTAYTEIANDTAQGLRALAAEAGIDAAADRAVVAAQVAQYVMSAARYDLNTAPTPEGVDFALYFLTERKQGYCVHYATAATLMLRALGIPARFTSGFLVTIPQRLEGRAASVTDGDAHAWVEVYYDGIGWVPLEVTAAYSNVAGAAAAYVPPDEPAQTPDTLPSARPTPTPSPSAPRNTGQAETKQGAEPEEAGPHIMTGLFIVLGLLAAMALALFARKFSQKKRAAAFAQTDTNAAVLYAWRYIHRLLGAKWRAPEEIETLAVKARFSRHVLTEEERGTVTQYAVTMATRADVASGRFRRLWLRYVRRLI